MLVEAKRSNWAWMRPTHRVRHNCTRTLGCTSSVASKCGRSRCGEALSCGRRLAVPYLRASSDGTSNDHLDERLAVHRAALPAPPTTESEDPSEEVCPRVTAFPARYLYSRRALMG